MKNLVNKEVGFLLNDEELTALKDMESKKNGLLLEEEMEWNLKSRVVSIEKGDQNNFFFIILLLIGNTKIQYGN
jgi:hypothetical protein